MRAPSLLGLSLPIVLAISTPLAAQEAPTLTPKQARVFAVGVIEFEDAKTWGSYPQEGRRDVELIQWFKDQGTPAEQIVYLQDAQATLAKTKAALDAHLAKSQPGELLVFYYTGHGSRQESGATCLVPRDCKGSDVPGTAWAVTDVLDTIQETFKGDRVLLIADCCYSGALGREAKKRPGKISWATLSSSLASAPSTGNWTFTESLLAGLRGDPRVDLDQDGNVLLSELARFTESEMAFADGQLSSFSTVGSFSAETILAKRAGELSAGRVGEKLEVRWKGQWYPARVLKEKGDRVFISYQGFGSDWDEWVGVKRSRPYKPLVHDKGTLVEVEWKGKWWPAKVLEGRLGLHRIHYDGFTDVWDEWVSPKRIRLR